VVDQAEIHRLVQSNDWEWRKIAVVELINNFSIFEDREQAWDDLIMLTQDKDDDVRWSAASALGSRYSLLPDELKKPAWDDIHRLTQDKNNFVRSVATSALGSCYSLLPDELMYFQNQNMSQLIVMENWMKF
jgi:HEAT repeat protein